MLATWRREDMGYAAAAAGAVAFLAYLVFGNFGLVPTPLGGAGIDEDVLVATQAVQAIQGEIDEDAPVVAPTPGEVPARERPIPVAPRPPAADTAVPAASFTTESGASFTLAEPAVVEGTATDKGSGIDEVNVTFTPASGSPSTVAAKLSCEDGHNACTWSAKVPSLIANYSAVAKATDREGNAGSSEEIELTVVNAGNTVTELTDTVKRVPSTLGKVVGGLVGGLL